MSEINKKNDWGAKYMGGDEFVNNKFDQTYQLIKVIK